LEIKEMPLEEKYDTLLDNYILTIATDYAFCKELGVLDKYFDLSVRVRKKMLPSLLGAAFKMFKAIAPSKAFKQIANRYVYSQQTFLPLSNIELTWISDREILARVRDCPSLKRIRKLLKKVDLDIDPRFHCEMETKVVLELAKEVGMNVTMNLEENGCVITGKPK